MSAPLELVLPEAGMVALGVSDGAAVELTVADREALELKLEAAEGDPIALDSMV